MNIAAAGGARLTLRTLVVLILGGLALRALRQPAALLRWKHYAECHSADSLEAGLDLKTLPLELSKPGELCWVKIYDRVASGEMPPKKNPRPAAEEIAGR